MRALSVALLLAAPAAASAAELSSIDDCIAALGTDPAATREAAARWATLGGGTPARICEAFAIEALGARQTAAEQLTEIAQEPTSGLAALARAALFDRAGLLWKDLGQNRLAHLTAAAATRLAPTPDRLQFLAEASAALGDWPAVLDALPPDRAPALRARALIETGQLEAAGELLGAANNVTPSLTLERARLAAARGDRQGALATLATLQTEDPVIRAARRALLQTLTAAAVAPTPAPDATPAQVPRLATAPRPRPRRP